MRSGFTLTQSMRVLTLLYFLSSSIIFSVPSLGQNECLQYHYDSLCYCDIFQNNIQILNFGNNIQKAGYNLIFNDEFSTLSNIKWNRSDPGNDSYNCMHQFMRNPANVSCRLWNEQSAEKLVKHGGERDIVGEEVDDGFAVLKNSNTAYGGCSFSQGEIKTFMVKNDVNNHKHDFMSYYFYKDFYIEFRVKLFSAIGQGTSLWLYSMGSKNGPGSSWGAYQEIDLFELIGGIRNGFTGAYIEVLGADYSNFWCNLFTGTQPYNLDDHWTIFGLKVCNDTMTWYVNNTPVRTIHSGPSECPYYFSSWLPPDGPLSIRMESNMSAAWMDNTTNALLPQESYVDYVRVYQRSNQSATPLEVADLNDPVVCTYSTSYSNATTRLRTHYYPEVVYQWSSDMFDISRDEDWAIPQPPERYKVWLKQNVGYVPGQGYNVHLHTIFPSGYTEDHDITLYIEEGTPPLVQGGFSPVQIGNSCLFKATHVALSGSDDFLFSEDLGQTWTGGIYCMQGGQRCCCFGIFDDSQTIAFLFKEHTNCGWSAPVWGVLKTPAKPSGCQFKAIIGSDTTLTSTDTEVHFTTSPQNDKFTITLNYHETLANQKIIVQIYNIYGFKVNERILTYGVNEFIIGDYKPGIYNVVLIRSGKYIYRNKVVKL